MNNPDNSIIKGKKQEPDTAATHKKEQEIWDETFETVIPEKEPFFETVSVRTKSTDKEDIDEDEIFRRLAAEDLAAEAEERAREAEERAREAAAENITESIMTGEADTVSEPEEASLTAAAGKRADAAADFQPKDSSAGARTTDSMYAAVDAETTDTANTDITADKEDTVDTVTEAAASAGADTPDTADTVTYVEAADMAAANSDGTDALTDAAADISGSAAALESAEEKPVPEREMELTLPEIAAAVSPEETPAASRFRKQSAPEKPSKRKKTIIIAAASLAGLLLLSSGIFLASHRSRDTFFARTYLANQDISGKTPEDVAREIVEKRKETMIVLTEKGTTTTSGRAEEFGYSLDEEALLAALKEAQDSQRHSAFAAFSSLVQSSDIPLKEVWVCDTDTLYHKVSSRNLMIKRIPSRDAALVYNENANRYVVTPEEYGNQFKPSDMQEWVKSSLDNWFAEASSEDLACCLEVPESIYWKPSVLQNSPSLHQEADALNIYAESKIIYTFGSQEVPLEFSTFRNWLSYKNGFLFWDTGSIESYVKKMASVYDTRGIDRDFTTTNGNTVHFNSYFVDYGYRINQERELEQLKKDLMSKTTVTREPVYFLYDKWDNVTFYKRDGVDDLAGTYIEVSLSNQHVWFYKDGKLIVETDCVTGNVAKGMETTPGMYAIAAKASPAVLRGGEGNGAYETPVNFWMPFNGGQGLHDATWRYYFGGKIYKTHGSHGCINLPYDAAKTIYENSKKGMAVIVY